MGGEGCDASGQGLLLVAGALVGTAEQAIKEFGVCRKKPGVELGRDFADPGADQWKRGLDDRAGFVREHVYS
jgi:hypothetical protein